MILVTQKRRGKPKKATACPPERHPGNGDGHGSPWPPEDGDPKKGALEMPSDAAGIVYTDFNDQFERSSQNWRSGLKALTSRSTHGTWPMSKTGSQLVAFRGMFFAIIRAWWLRDQLCSRPYGTGAQNGQSFQNTRAHECEPAGI